MGWIGMGWWNATEESHSLQPQETGIVWGDGPADTMDDALANITKQFEAAWGRKPTNVELLAGLKFSLPDEEE